ncbi:[Fe-Fe] hydrogenase large subunit C-terminal domain-containing protein [Anaeromicrobium sediminis]|uniref:Iron hydrogenase n=1 Tax=Anaeromicrobium sediminis TaxID=1478221 RepID=A0A267MIG4_9FIRM|nr:[Fe-Fe] hydrogenase large subunit C-terminal domain-containing protein [Anaeromicrobium sediminis]PAB59237.1 iron hydrogenase [Anaeromicrobium sediminis]
MVRNIDRFKDFQEKRMAIFSEVVKRYWNGNLEDSKDLNSLARDIREKYDFLEEDMPFIKDHIRVAMGLNPKTNYEFSDEIEIIKNSREVAKPIISKIEGPCEYCDEESCTCKGTCKYEAHIYRRSKGPVIEEGKCLTCGECSNGCDFGALVDKIEFVPLIDLLKDKNTKVYASIAPSIAGQFGKNVTLGQMRTALKLLGFEDMVEVALFADILTIKEAFEVINLVKTEDDFYLTSCCCPVWFNMVKKNYPKLFEHMPPSVSPMIASGRFLKELYKDIKVVFISPCTAKKAEAKEPDLKGDIDFVLTFRELKEIFKTLNIDPEKLKGDDKDQASFAGRLYGRTGGVSFSVKTIVNRLEPRRLIKLKSKKIHGVKACKETLEELSNNEKVDYNFVEGMGCVGGCVGGPRTNIPMNEATNILNETGEDSLIMTPFDNMNLMKILKELGIERIEDIVEENRVSQLLKRQ